MARVYLGLIIGLLVLQLGAPTQAASEYLYLEELNGFYRINGETFRWDDSREFLLRDYVFYDKNSTQFVNATILDRSNHGLLRTVNHQMRDFNFRMQVQILEDGKLANIEWDMILFRNPVDVADPFTSEERSVLTKGENERYDLRHDQINFTVALEYFEFHEIDGELTKLRVNTELASDNELDGRVIRTAIHIVKRDPNGRILFDYNWSIKQVNTFYRIFNFLDQPFLAVPIQLGLIFLGIYIYIRLQRYVVNHEFQILKDGKPLFEKKEGKKDSEEEEQPETEQNEG